MPSSKKEHNKAMVNVTVRRMHLDHYIVRIDPIRAKAKIEFAHDFKTVANQSTS